MSDFTSEILGQLDANRIQAIASQLGLDPAQAQAAITQAVPVVVGGLARNASTESGASALRSALDAHGGADFGTILGSVLGGGGQGGAILGHIFGNRQDQAAQQIGRSSGIGTANAGALLAMLAPLVMGMLGNRAQGQGIDAGGLGSMLGRELQGLGRGAQGGLMGAVFDQDGDGQFGLSDVLKLGSQFFGRR
ncbi:MAG: DUF937 domain-containing protein [Dokdonella sp.]|uniref:DUF937 domain-containing protein n=1 Tax=Dokdonella sp. TaxID=2291710 RepID=UPI0025B7C3DA|nr:DUF937 domain-containing protein [Dokdonella sp.]MBX3701922.1 DUF937 domain-containing protein [Dokdonella sp.]